MRKIHLLAIPLLFFVSCDLFRNIAGKKNKDDKKITFQILQVNDVYEITPLDNGRIGGLARIATLNKQLKAKNPNTYFILAGDFLNPSALGTLKYEGERINGRQMVEVLNTAGLDYVTFGNHEFDLKEPDLQKRLNESNFTWIASNIDQKQGSGHKPFAQIKGKDTIPTIRSKTIEMTDLDGTHIHVALVSATLKSLLPDYVHHEDAFTVVHSLIPTLKADVILGVTHQNREDDKKMAAIEPSVALWIGGHDHENSIDTVGKTFVTKADANGKTAYVHTITYHTDTKKTEVSSQLVNIDASYAEDVETKKVVDKWLAIAEQSFAKEGINPNAVVTELKTPWDAREAIIRTQPTEIASVICKSMLYAAPHANAAILNTGSIRIDDVVEGKVTEYDIVRILPFGGAMKVAEMKGSLLKKIMEAGEKNKGRGGYLQYANIENGLISGNMIGPDMYYYIVLPEFLLSGKESNLEFLTEKNPDIKSIYGAEENNSGDLRRNLQLALIAYLRAEAKRK